MSIKYQPEYGQVLICDFPKDLKEPEMVKRRPVVCLSPRNRNRHGLVTVIPLSTTKSKHDEYSVDITLDRSISESFPELFCWAKCDMIYTLGFDRFHLPSRGKDLSGKRIYDKILIDEETMKEIVSVVNSSISC